MLHYNETGNGYPIVLLHGFCEKNTCFNKQVFLLKEHFKIICPDLPGSGKSEYQISTSIEEMADAVYETLMHAGIKKCILIGHSMGGYVTMAFAKKYAHLLDGFGLLHSVATPDDEERRQKRVQAQRTIAEKGVVFYARQFIPPMFKNGTDENVIAPYLNDADTFSAEGLTAQLEAMKNRDDHTDTLKQTRLPVFFGVGKFDSLIPEDKMLQQAISCRQSYVAYLPESGHMGHIEQDELTAKHITHFADGVKSF